MATFASIMTPGEGAGGRDGVITTAISANASTGDIVIGFRMIFVIVADSAIHVRWGTSSTIAAAVSTDFLIPANTLVQLDMGEAYDRIRAFAATGATGNVYVLPMCRGK